MKTTGKMLIALVALVLAIWCVSEIAQGQDVHQGQGSGPVSDSIPATAKSPKLDAKEAEQAAQMKILKAKVALKTAQSDLDQLQIQYSQNKQRYDEAQAQIQQKAPAAQQTVQLKQQILKSEEDAACKAAIGAEADKYTYDEDKGTCSPKAEPAPPTPSPAKK